MMRVWPTFVGPALVLLAVSTASAEDSKRVLVLTYQGVGSGVPPELNEQTTVVVSSELKASGIDVVRADDVALGGVTLDTEEKKGGSTSKNAPTGDAKAGDKAKELLSRAQLSMEDQEFPAAIKQLGQAIRLLDDNGDAVPDLRLLPQAHLQKAIAHFRDGEEDEADDSLTKAVHFDPERELDESEFPPIFIRAYERVRFNVLRRPRARIEVKAASGAQVLFDGRNLGKAPLVMTEVLPGEHWIRIERPGEAPQVKKVLVRGRRTILVEFDGASTAAEPESDAPAGVLGAIATNEINRSHVSQLRAAGRREKADFVLFGGIYKTETAYNIYTALVRVKDGEVGRLVDIAFDLDLLSAQIEVYKLAEDAQKEVAGGRFSRIEEAPAFPISAKVKLRKRRAPKVATTETRMQSVRAAPLPVEAPAPPTLVGVIPEPTPPPAPGPTAAAPAVVAPPEATVVPKDEMGDTPKPAMTPVVAAPIQNPDDNDGGSMWWVWVIVGVAAAGAAGAGGYFVFANQSPDEGELTIRWTP